ncbi:molybdopterin-dependent oxidoreductase [Stappia sp. F7233]|uniref:Molybdopterin-dependent oxidoreductase n=1 Tax=Stappia albiluteola TaxID=2758565 RepID=A0A839AF03_9HYPH|nr:nitrate reductase [Stappia albiluteola]MBA5777149.1 molybdopterin-dependent oxidoreductase [Stappia albiluteola]
MNDARKEVKTTCPYCGVGCGVIATVGEDGAFSVRGDPDHPANFGRLCSKGSALAETIGPEGRLLEPEVMGERTDWDTALSFVADRFSETIAEHGPDSVAFYVSGQLLTEDYYVANKLMKGFIGSANIDTNSRLCMASSVAGHRRAFGSDTVPGTYEDLELADLVVIVGSNMAWCHPVLYQRLAAAKQARPGTRVVLVDPRRTMTADIADLHLPLKPDSDIALFNGLLRFLAAPEGSKSDTAGRPAPVDADYVASHTEGFDEALEAALAYDMARVSRETGLDEAQLAEFYELFAGTEKVVTLYSQGVNQSVVGTDKVNAILNCHLATGRIGKAGSGPFSLTGQPNAMGGREVGGLANMLAAHMAIENPQHRQIVQEFWGSPTVATTPGKKAVDLFTAIEAGDIKAVWVMATNPVDSMPDADGVARALAACPLVVVSDVVAENDTLPFAHVRLPAAAWAEKDGTVTNSERRISRQRKVLSLPGKARHDWWIVCEVARRMGFADAFAYAGPHEIFAEHAAISSYRNDGSRAFDIGAHAAVDRSAYDGLAPFQWPQPVGKLEKTTRFFARGGFFHPDGRARLVPVTSRSGPEACRDFPFTLNTGRVRDHWHTMTRTGLSPRLSSHLGEPFAELHPADALDLGVADADLVEIASPYGSVIVRALVTGRQQQGSVFVPMHWTGQFAARARVDTLVPPRTDPHSGQPASKNIAVHVSRFAAQAYGFAVLSRKPAAIDADYWALARCKGGYRLEFASAHPFDDREALLRRWCGGTGEIAAYRDAATDGFRAAVFEGGRLLGALFTAREPVAVSRAWAASQLIADHGNGARRALVVAGRSGSRKPDPGALVCSCFGVGANDILGAIAGGCHSIEAIGQQVKAGTNCGSCRSEIKVLLDRSLPVAAE